MKLGELLVLLGVTKAELRPGISRESHIIIMPQESDGFDVKDIIHFKEQGNTGPQIWFVIDEHGERWFTEDEEINVEDVDIENPSYEREGDMCTLPEVSGDPVDKKAKCNNPFCKNGMTEWGPCMGCKVLVDKEKPKIDPCENQKHKARMA